MPFNVKHTGLLITCALALGVIAGCGDELDSDAGPTLLRPSDFIATTDQDIDDTVITDVTTQPDVTDTTVTETQTETENTDVTLTDADDPDAIDTTNPDTNLEEGPAGLVNQVYQTDGMVGHISGRPIFTDDIFAKIGVDTLKRFGTQESEAVFRQRVSQLLTQTLRAQLEETLLVDEALRELPDNKRQSLDFILNAEKERLVNQYGAGSVFDANANMLQILGRTLNEELEFRRQRLLVQDLLQSRVWARIQVSRRDTLRYYANNPKEFAPDPLIKYRLLLINNANDRRFAARDVRRGTPIEELITKYTPTRPTMEEASTKLADFNIFGPEALNEALRQMQPGQISDPVLLENGIAWLELVSVEEGVSRTYEQAYFDIVGKLRAQQYQLLYLQLQNDLQYDGSFTDPRRMAETLLEIAVTRYAVR